MRKGLLALVLVMMATFTNACDEHGVTGIVEKNDLYIPVGQKSNGGLTEEEFNDIIDKVESIYKPIIAQEFNATLSVERNWTDGTVNAYASQSGRNWKVAMFGGLARHETITRDGFATVICHEIGHHIGGAPKKKSFWSSSWASNEGQADYFGTSKCLRRFMELDDNATIVSKMEIPTTVEKKCSVFTTENEIAMCQRGAMAGMSLANLFHALRNLQTPLKFDTPDSRVVTTTDDNHPAPQCRLDTYFSGAICTVDHEVDASQTDAKIGFCNRVDGMTDGVRPLCWYKPSAN
ncbi:M48 family metalloprotease [Bacteriovorax sp. Seq25_V]|uniref:M48 family metalloprotease n=1 Tax=Bacteriovorax sp. Seq25_V TaxID=1201288 RepID=UPI00038A536B|nr:M48 family metalloprotease [Bacteriovorax sp. Seq25_V]EQC44387.1 peptidase, M48 domain protein [Bacteriovorax sp. Seq25_V]